MKEQGVQTLPCWHRQEPSAWVTGRPCGVPSLRAPAVRQVHPPSTASIPCHCLTPQPLLRSLRSQPCAGPWEGEPRPGLPQFPLAGCPEPRSSLRGRPSHARPGRRYRGAGGSTLTKNSFWEESGDLFLATHSQWSPWGSGSPRDLWRTRTLASVSIPPASRCGRETPGELSSERR